MVELGINVFESNGREREGEGERIWTHQKKERKDRFNRGASKPGKVVFRSKTRTEVIKEDMSECDVDEKMDTGMKVKKWEWPSRQLRGIEEKV